MAHQHVTTNYMEHGFCLNWEKSLVFLHVGSDIITGLSYYSIPIAMFYFAYRRRDLPFFKIFVMFAVFILSCGTTHLFSAYTIFRPEYWIEGYIKAFTAVISALTAAMFIPRIPDAIAFPSIVNSLAEIKILNSELSIKNAELQMANFSIENVLDPVYWFSADGRILRANTAGSRVLGYTADELLGLRIFDLDPNFPPERWPEHWNELKAKGGLTFETQNRKKDGSLLDVEVTASYLFYEGEEFNCALVRDITLRKRAKEENAKLEQQLQQSQKLESVGRLAGGVAHDFNNLLGVILGYSEMALMKIEPSHPHYDAFVAIRNASERSANLTRQLLAFARKQTIAPKVIDLNEAISGMLNMLQRLIGENIHLSWRPAPDLWLVKVDPSQIDQILVNLCINARDAINDVGNIGIETQNGVVDESYSAAHKEFVPGEYVRLVVSDDGAGMDKETVTHIFEPFYTTKELGKGTGLGLATVYGIVKQNNGFINVYSEPGQGTAFSIYLPRYRGEEGQALKGDVTGVMPSLGKGTILLVEDEPAILEMASLMLEELGYTVLAAGTTGEAIRLFKEHTDAIQLLMTDVVMPDMNGYDLSKKLSSLSPQLKCLFMSGYTANVIAHHGVLDEGMHFIQKPFSLPDLATKLQEVLAGR